MDTHYRKGATRNYDIRGRRIKGEQDYSKVASHFLKRDTKQGRLGSQDRN